MRIKARLILPSSQELMKTTGLDVGGRCQKYIDEQDFDRSEPYLPGPHIYRHSKSSNVIGSGKVVWIGEDVNYLYEGKLMVDPITLKGAFFSPNFGYWSRPNVQKIMDPNGRTLDYHGGGKRGSKWFDRMIDNEMDEIVKGLQNIVDGRK